MSVLSAGIALAMAGSALAADGNGRYIVQLEEGVSAKLMTSHLGGKIAGKSAKIHHEFEDLGAIAMSLSKEQLKALRNDPRVKNIEVDPKRYPMAQSRPYGIDMVGAPSAWASGHTGNGVMVCVIDSGLKADHEDFAGVDVRGGYPSTWSTDTCGHGTHVAGTIAAQDNSLGVVGVSPGDVSMYIVRYFGGANCGFNYASTLIDAANRCKTAADAAGKKLVINMSLGGGGASTTEGNGFQNLLNQGVLSIAAAGNDGNTTLSYPASYDAVVSVAALDSSKTLATFSQRNAQVELAAPGVAVLSTYPISSASASVGGASYIASALTDSPQLNRSGTVVDGGRCTASGSWSGRVVLCERGDISFADKVVNAQNGGATAVMIYNNAPGGFGGTLGGASTSIPSVSISQEDGVEIRTSRLGQSGNVNTIASNNANAYSNLDGTSMATPHVAGAAAVVWSSNLSASAQDVRDALTSTAEDLGSAGRDTSYGHGLIDIPAAIAALAGPVPDTTPPSTVSGLNATASSTSAIALSWSSASDTGGSGLAGYKIERCTGASCSNYTQIATTASTSFSNTGLAAATTYRYRVRAYDGAGNNGGYSSIASATTQSAGGGGGSVLTNGVPATGLSGATGTQLAYTIVVPAGASNLSFNLSGGSGDADLYVRFASAPTTSTYDCRSWASGNTESCSFASPQAGTYHVLLNAYATFSGASLVASFDPPSGGGASFFQNTADVAIPDNNSTGVTSSITVSGRSGNAPSNLQVAVDIRHTYIGDLIVDLLAPDGSVYNLHNRSGGGTDNIIGTYTVNASSEAANGNWRLRVRDRARQDTGYINSWSLQF